MVADAPPDRRLDSWKEIAEHFDREVRTVQRWEKREGLPIHRHVHARRCRVYAFESELETWRRSRDEEPSLDFGARRRPWLRSLTTVGTAAVLAIAAVAIMTSRAVERPMPVSMLRQWTIAGDSGSGRIRLLRTGDLDGDGSADLALTTDHEVGIRLLLPVAAKRRGGHLSEMPDTRLGSTVTGRLLVADVGDFNGDGLDDLMVTRDLTEWDGYTSSSSAYLVFGRRSWPASLDPVVAADVEIRGHPGRDIRMSACRSADLDGDGVAEVMLRAVEYTPTGTKSYSAGGVFVWRGRRTWPASISIAEPDLLVHGSRMGEALGTVCAVGDLDGQEGRELALVAAENTLWGLLGGRGRLYVLRLPDPWPRRLAVRSESDVVLRGEHEDAPASVLLMADVNGDGRDDVVAATPEVPSLPDFPGHVYIRMGGSATGVGSTHDADVVIRGPRRGAGLGVSMAAADLDRDGREDLLVAEPGRGVYLLYGRERWRDRGTPDDYGAVPLLEEEEAPADWEIDVADIDGDGLHEILMLAPEATLGAFEETGRIWVVSPYLPLRVDVRPGARPNVLVPGGVLAARLLGFAGAGLQIDPATVRIGDAPAIAHRAKDYNGDGVEDLQVYAEVDALGLPADAVRLRVVARTRSGMLVAGEDDIEWARDVKARMTADER